MRGHSWWAPLDLLPLWCHAIARRQAPLRNTARPRRSPARRHRGRPVCPRSAFGRSLTAGSGVGGRLSALDGGPGGARGAPPAINQMTIGGNAARHRIVVARTRTRWPQFGRIRASGLLIPSGCPWLHRGSSPGCPSKWRRPDPVLCMSQRAESRPGASRAGDNSNHLTEGSRTRGPVNAQPRGFITPTMRPMMSVGQGSQIRPTSGLNRAPESKSSQLRGLIISVPGVHQRRTSPSTPFPSSPSGRTISLCSVCCPMSAGAVHGLMNGSVLVVIDDDIRPGHSANEPPTSPALASSFGSTVTPSQRWNRTRRNNSEPKGFRVQESPDTQITLTMRVHESGSKMVEQVPCLRRRCRWPRTRPVPEGFSGSLRWAS